MINKKVIIIVALAFLIIILGFLSYHFHLAKIRPKEKISLQSEKFSHPPCLSLTEEVQYEAYENKEGPSTAKISIKDKNTNKVIFEFQIENIVPNHYHPYEIHKCGIYLVREFNFDYKKGKPLPNFRMEVWRYRYDGNGEKLVEENDFRVDPNEEYLAIERSYLGQPDYALVIKDLKTKEDVFVLPLKSITDKYPSLEGSIDLIKWTKDSRYFWGRTFTGAYTLGFFRVDTTNWKVEVFETPEGVLGGSALNIEKGYVTRHPGYVWVGIDIIKEQIKKEWREQGKISSLYLYNLFTKEESLVATTTEPLWFFNPKWISERELEYELPNGEKKIYKLNQ